MLIDTAMVRIAADLVSRHGTWVCVQTGEFIPGTDVAVKDGHIAFVGPDASHTINRDTLVIEAEGKYLVPGLLDGHLHVESGMLTVTEYVRAVIPHGTTGMFIDPHEIANVFGLQGIRLMADEALKQPIHVYVQVPSCVPSAPGMETSGGEITPADVAEALTWEGVIGLGEMMNYPGVAAGDPQVLAKLDATRKAGRVIGGHYAGMDLGLPFHAYAAGGAEDDHEGTRLEDAVARARQGMKPMLRYSSAWQDVAAQVEAVTRLGLDPRHFILCTDDCHAETLVGEGHMDRVVRHAISLGLPPMTALQMSTINTAEHFGLAREIGHIAPGRWADILLVQDLAEFQPEMVIGKGKILAVKGELQVSLPEMEYPDWVRRSIHLKQPLMAADFAIKTVGQETKVKVNVIGVTENQAPTRHLVLDFQPVDGEIRVDVARDVIKLAVVERHHATGSIQVGLVTGFGFSAHGAVASTVAHDCHQIIVMGTDEQDMSLAVNTLVEMGGGQVVIKDGQDIGRLALPIAGLMSNERADRVAAQAQTILDGFKACGCRINNPNMTMSLLALVVIPELRLSDKGLVDVNTFSFIPVVQE